MYHKRYGHLCRMLSLAVMIGLLVFIRTWEEDRRMHEFFIHARSFWHLHGVWKQLSKKHANYLRPQIRPMVNQKADNESFLTIETETEYSFSGQILSDWQDQTNRVCVCFFGQVKHFEDVSNSIQRHVFDVLKAAGFEYDNYVHTDKLSTYSNKRNSEHNSSVDPTSIERVLRSGISTIEYGDVEDADRSHNISKLLTHGDPWPENPVVSVRNFIRQLYSLKRVTQLWKHRAHEYDLCLYLRPDLQFTSDLDLPTMMQHLNASSIATPGWHQSGGLNDRMAFGLPAVMALYGERGDELEDYVVRQQRKPHAEEYLGFYLASHGIVNVDSNTSFRRVRADGRIEMRDKNVGGAYNRSLDNAQRLQKTPVKADRSPRRLVKSPEEDIKGGITFQGSSFPSRRPH